MSARLYKRRRTKRPLERHFYTMAEVAEMTGVSYYTIRALVAAETIPAMSLTGSLFNLVPAFWLADVTAQCVEAYGPPATAAGIKAIAKAGVTPDVLMHASQAYSEKQAQEAMMRERAGDPESRTGQGASSPAPEISSGPALKDGS